MIFFFFLVCLYMIVEVSEHIDVFKVLLLSLKCFDGFVCEMCVVVVN